jgi:ABC-2 type transport system ATP-binding protein
MRDLTDLCAIREVMHKPIGELSKGFKQRVGLAHAMMNDPEILVLDEPTSGLDPNQIVEIRDIIKRIGKHKTIILSTHILSEAEATCDRVVIINGGKIVADDSTESLKQSVSGEYVIHMSLENADITGLKKALDGLDGIRSVDLTSEGQAGAEGLLHVEIACKSSSDLRGLVYARIKKTDWVLLELYRETRSLENIFRVLTKEQ